MQGLFRKTEVRVAFALACILLVALSLRLYDLSGPDMSEDDVLYSMRSIGYIDYVGSEDTQTTPVMWFAEPQWWQRLSFHDHPPFVFIIQHLFFSVFGVSVFVARLPFVLAGVLTVFFVFLLGRKLWNTEVGLYAAGALALSNYAIWISRIGYLDGFLVLFVALSLFLFVKAQERSSYYLWWTLSVALGILTKYTFLFILPVFAVVFLLFRRKAFKEPWLYGGFVLAALMLSPVVMYNFMMWQTRGHFDIALSLMLGQLHDDFRIVSTQLATIRRSAFETIRAFCGVSGAGFLVLFLYGLLKSAVDIRVHIQTREKWLLIGGTFFSALTLLFLTGNTTRYGVVLLPCFALYTGYSIYCALHVARTWKPLVVLVVGLAVAGELFFSIQNQLVSRPVASHFLAQSAVSSERGGYRYLDEYVARFLEEHPGKPVSLPHGRTPQLTAHERTIAQSIHDKHPDWPNNEYLFVYDEHLQWFASMWIFDRRSLYDITPTHPLTSFLEILKTVGTGHFEQFGFKYARVFVPSEHVPQNSRPPFGEDAKAFLQTLKQSHTPADEIRNADGTVLFYVYELSFEDVRMRGSL